MIVTENISDTNLLIWHSKVMLITRWLMLKLYR